MKKSEIVIRTAERSRKFFEAIAETATPRRCGRCSERSIAWIYRADKRGRKDRTSREAVCRGCLARETPNL
jgi:hypothetical protein